jgi:hypothetical protein
MGKTIRIVAVLAGLAMVPCIAQTPNDLEDGGRQVTLKPISESRPGGDGGNGWVLAGALGGLGLLCVGAVVTAMVLKMGQDSAR